MQNKWSLASDSDTARWAVQALQAFQYYTQDLNWFLHMGATAEQHRSKKGMLEVQAAESYNEGWPSRLLATG